jgi:hypothetical protein
MLDARALLEPVRTIARRLLDSGIRLARGGSRGAHAVAGEGAAPDHPASDREAAGRPTFRWVQTTQNPVPLACVTFRPPNARVLSAEQVAAALRRHVVLSMIFADHLGAASEPA